jgi:cytochrome P450
MSSDQCFRFYSTTAGMTSWHLAHISMHPEVQERIRDELLAALETTNGVMTADTVSPKSAPYLHAAFRESHRINNPSPLVPMKRIQMDVNLHGVDIPAGNVVIFDGISKSHNLVENPDKFDPDRWLPEAVEARRGTPAAVLDHVLFKGPFSEGARRCPGSRVAKNESLLLMAQLIVDWKMETSVKHWRDIKYRMDTVITPILPKIEFTARA